MTRLAQLWRRDAWAVTAFVLAVLAALLFAANALRAGRDLLDDTPAGVEPWMTPGLAAQVLGLPPEDLAQRLHLPPGALPHQTLEQIAAARGVPVAALIAALPPGTAP